MTRRTASDRAAAKPPVTGQPVTNTPAPEPAAALPAATTVAGPLAGDLPAPTIPSGPVTDGPVTETAPVLTGEVLDEGHDDITLTEPVPDAVIPAAPDTAVAETTASSALPAHEAARDTAFEAALADLLTDDAPRVKVICHTVGGRRRAGRRWPEGETILPLSDLTEREKTALQGDPRFTVGLLPHSAET